MGRYGLVLKDEMDRVLSKLLLVDKIEDAERLLEIARGERPL